MSDKKLVQYYDGNYIHVVREREREYAFEDEYRTSRPFWFVCETSNDSDSKYINDADEINSGFLPSEDGSKWYDERELQSLQLNKITRLELVLENLKLDETKKSKRRR